MKTLLLDEKTTHREYEYSEFVDFAEKTPKSTSHDNFSSREGKKDFTGTNNFAEAIDFARHGWDSGLKQLELENGTLANTGIEFEPTVAGAMVNIGAYLQGVPENMWAMRENREYLLEELTIVVPLSYSAYISEADALTFCKNIISIVNEYQAKYNVKLVGSFNTGQSKNGQPHRHIVDVVIKDFDVRFNINNIAFAFHPSFFRRLWFVHLEAETYCTSGYGRPGATSDVKTIVTKNLGTNKVILLPALSSDNRGSKDISKEIQKFNF